MSRYDGEQFVTITTEDGLGSNYVSSLLEDGEGHLWFGTGDPRWGIPGGGVSQYDPSASSGGTGKDFVTLTTEDGLANNVVVSILEDGEPRAQGNL